MGRPLSHWVVPEYLRQKSLPSISIQHPPTGIGRNNFALYEEAKEHGLTCHHMVSDVDTGAIIAVKRFPVFPTDNIATLLLQTYDYQLVLSYEIVSFILGGTVDKETIHQKRIQRVGANNT